MALVTPPNSGMSYQVLLPGFAAARLGGGIGQTVVLFTLYYIESQGQGATMIPRLAGFLTAQDRSFFELFTTCKGIGNRKALRAMALDIGQLANAIADRDAAMLQTLPEIGRRTAETIVATLFGKVDRFISPISEDHAGGLASNQKTLGVTVSRHALEVLLQLGENRIQAIEWIDQVSRGSDTKAMDVQEWVAAVYRLKGGQ